MCITPLTCSPKSSVTNINVNDICRAVELYGVTVSKAFFFFHSILPQLNNNEMRELIGKLTQLSSEINDTVMMFLARFCNDGNRG